MKNCGHHFHTSIATKDFLGELVKIIGRRYEAPQAVQEKVLLLFQVNQQMPLMFLYLSNYLV